MPAPVIGVPNISGLPHVWHSLQPDIMPEFPREVLLNCPHLFRPLHQQPVENSCVAIKSPKTMRRMIKPPGEPTSLSSPIKQPRSSPAAYKQLCPMPPPGANEVDDLQLFPAVRLQAEEAS